MIASSCRKFWLQHCSAFRGLMCQHCRVSWLLSVPAAELAGIGSMQPEITHYNWQQMYAVVRSPPDPGLKRKAEEKSSVVVSTKEWLEFVSGLSL
ncbi:hypothetical protein GOP47_0010122 [Adiantum capillus-veneris]|uniref:Uncharacterized protein n=1 Tax=Adiantum capillus-veneris TaxID=13818 RepID=A0A9D4UUH8_ADICA|nr:hypothetical protein GOP47_0010122 [Adiantum capillus-veneris]